MTLTIAQHSQPTALAADLAQFQAAYEAYDAATVLTDAIRLGREPNPAEETLFAEVERRCHAASAVLMAYEPANLSELAALAPVLANNNYFEPGDAAPRLAQHVQRLASSAPDPDAELIELGHEWDRLLPEHERRLQLFNARVRSAHAAAGKLIEQGSYDEAGLGKIYKTVEEAAGVHREDCDLNMIDTAMWHVQARAEALRATSLAGLRVKVAIAMFWRQPDVDSAEIDSLLNDLGAMLGIALPTPLSADAGASSMAA